MARIPAAWLKSSWEATTLGGWFTGLLQVRRAVVSRAAGQAELHVAPRGLGPALHFDPFKRPIRLTQQGRPLTPCVSPHHFRAQRHDQLAKWLMMGRPRAYWLTGFFNPQVGVVLWCRALHTHTHTHTHSTARQGKARHLKCSFTSSHTHAHTQAYTHAVPTTSFCLQGFLTAIKQEVNRKHAADKWALDDVVMTSEVGR